MKSLLTAAVMVLAATAFSAGESWAQSSPVTPSGMGATSPVGTGPGAFAPDPRGAALPYSATASPTPCSAENQSATALPTFDGGQFRLSTNSLQSGAVDATNGLSSRGTYGVGSAAPSPCNSVSSSGVMSAASSPSAISASTNSSSVSSPASVSGNSTTAASPTSSAAGAAGNGLGSVSLGTSGLGAVALGSLPMGAAATAQATSPSTGVAGSPTFCSGASSGSSAVSMTRATNAGAMSGPTISMNGGAPTASAGGNASGLVRNPAQGVVGGLYNPAQTLAGAASLSTTNATGAPCMIGE